MIGDAYNPIHDPAAMFVVSGMTAALAIFGFLATGPSLRAWFGLLEMFGFRVSPESKTTRMTLGRMLPLPFGLVSIAALFLGLFALFTR